MSLIDAFLTEAELHPPGSDSRKLLTWAAAELPDRQATIESLEEDDEQRFRENQKLRDALLKVADIAFSIEKYARDAAFNMQTDNTLSHDLTSFVNCMMAHGADPYAKKPRKKKGEL